jgi:hypothetical protein
LDPVLDFKKCSSTQKKNIHLEKQIRSTKID